MRKGILAVGTGLLLGMLMLAGCGKAVKTEEKKEVSEKLVDVCEHFFETSKGEYRAIDKDGKDITDDFYEQYQSAYTEKDYETIADAAANDLKYIKWTEQTEDQEKSSELTARTITEDFYVMGQAKELFKGKSFDMVFSITGEFQFLKETGEVQEYGDSMFSVEYFNAGTGITYMAQDVSTEARKNADGQVEFSADFSVKLSGQNEKGDVGEEIAGPYHGEALGEGEKK